MIFLVKKTLLFLFLLTFFYFLPILLLFQSDYFSYQELVEIHTISQNCKNRKFKKDLNSKYDLFNYTNQVKYYTSMKLYNSSYQNWKIFLVDSYKFFLKLNDNRDITIKYFYPEGYKPNYNKFNENYLITEKKSHHINKNLKLDLAYLPYEYYKVFITKIYPYSFLPENSKPIDLILLIEHYKNKKINSRLIFNENSKLIQEDIYKYNLNKKISKYFYSKTLLFKKEENI